MMCQQVLSVCIGLYYVNDDAKSGSIIADKDIITIARKAEQFNIHQLIILLQVFFE